MKKTAAAAAKFSEAQIIFALRQADTGVPVAEVCRKMGVSEATYYNWNAGEKKYAGLGVPELRNFAAGRGKPKVKTARGRVARHRG